VDPKLGYNRLKGEEDEQHLQNDTVVAIFTLTREVSKLL
jgi:hypothetical protein